MFVSLAVAVLGIVYILFTYTGGDCFCQACRTYFASRLEAYIKSIEPAGAESAATSYGIRFIPSIFGLLH